MSASRLSSKKDYLKFILFAGSILVTILIAVALAAIIFKQKSQENTGNISKSNSTYEYEGSSKTVKAFFLNKENPNSLYSIENKDTKSSMRFSLKEGQYKADKSNAKIDQKDNKTYFTLPIHKDILLKYNIEGEGVKEDIIINNKETANNIVVAFELTIDKLTPETLEDGTLTGVFIDDVSKDEFSLTPPYMIDSKGERSDLVNLSIYPTEETNKYDVYVTPDNTWMQDEDRQYPITIDPSVVKGTAPISKWSIDEAQGSTIYDASTNANNLTLTNATWQVNTARSGSYGGGTNVRFDGSGDYLSRAYDADYDFGTGSFSVSMWFRIPSAAAGPDILLARYADAGFKIYMDASEYICFGIDDDNSWGPDDSACSATSFNDSQWHHLEAIKTSTTSIELYIDGIQRSINSSTGADSTLSGTTPVLYIGIDSDGTSNSFQGDLDSITIYNYARTGDQVENDAFVRPQTGASFGGSTVNSLTSGLVGHWKMDENTGTSVADNSGNANSLTITAGSGSWYNPGKYGSAYTFSSTVMAKTDVASLNPTTSLTLSAWINGASFLNNGIGSTIISKGSSVTDWPSFALTVNNSLLRIFLTPADNNYVTLDSSTVLSTSTWYHVAMAWDGSKIKLFINGKQEQNTANLTSAIRDDVLDFNLGKMRTGGEFYWDGKIDEVRIYNRALSPGEVRALYNWAPGPSVQYNFDEGSGTNVYDKSGNAINAAFQGSSVDPAWVRGIYGWALNFDGSDDYLRSVHSTAWDLNSTDTITIEEWIKFDGSTASSGGYLWGDGDGPLFFLTRISDTTYQLCWFSNASECGNTLTYEFNRWYHVAAVKQGTSSVTFYRDGINAGTDSSISGEIEDQTGTYLGGGSAGWLFDGSIDEMRYYNYARTPSQIIEDMNAGHPAPGSPVGSANSYWKFDEGYGTTAYDFGVNDDDLTLSTASWTTSGKFGKAFAGASNYRLSKTDDPDLDFAAADDFTLSGWFKRNTVSAAEYLIYKVDSNEGYAVYMDSDGDIVFGISDTNSVSFPEESIGGSLSKNYDDNLWHYFTAVKNGTSSIKLYVDTKLIAEDTSLAVDVTLENAGVFYVADANAADGTDEFLGTIDEIKVYRSALSQNQINADANQGKSNVFGSNSTASDGKTADFSSAREYCVPGDTSTCNAPVAHWKFDENAGTSNVYDSSGNNYIATLGGSMTASNWASGVRGSSLYFDGSNDYVLVSSASGLIYQSGDFSVSVWAKPTSLSGYSGLLTIDTTGDSGWKIFHDTGTDYFQARFYTSTLNYPVVAVNEWHHYYYVKSGTTLKIYLDGAYVTQATVSATHDVAGSEVLMGSYRVNDGKNAANMFKGYMDEPRIYGYARTPAQIAWEYNRGAPVAWYKFDECTGTNIEDWSPNGNGGYNSKDGSLTIGGSGTNTTTGTCSSGPGAWFNGATGKINSAMDFDGTDDYVRISNNTQLNPTIITVSAWVKSKTATWNQWAYAVAQRTSTDGHGYILSPEAGGSGTDFTFFVGINGSWQYKTISSYGDIQQWHMYTGTYDGETVSIYVDGKLRGVNTAPSGPITYTGTDTGISIGDDDVIDKSGLGTRFGNALIDDVRIYNYALTPVQVRDVYNNTSVSFK